MVAFRWKGAISRCAIALVTFCVGLTLAEAVFAGDQGIVLPSRESGNYSASCTEEWTKRGVLDQDMYAYCMRHLNDAYNKLATEAEKYKSLPWLQDVVNDAVSEWTKRGMRDDEMVAYTVHGQIDAYLDLQYASQQPSFQKSQYELCFKERHHSAFVVNSIDWEAIRCCYNKATNGPPRCR